MQESTDTMNAGVLAGANFVLQVAGWLEGGLSIGYGKFVTDLDRYGTRLSNERRERRRRDYRRSLFFPLKEVAVARDNELGVMNAGQGDQVVVFGIPGQWNDLTGVGNQIHDGRDGLDVQLGDRKLDPAAHPWTFRKSFLDFTQ